MKRVSIVRAAVLMAACAAGGVRRVRRGRRRGRRATAPAAAPALEIHGTLDAVTVYRGQALVIAADGGAGAGGAEGSDGDGIAGPDRAGVAVCGIGGGGGGAVDQLQAHPVEKDVRADVQVFDEQDPGAAGRS